MSLFDDSQIEFSPMVLLMKTTVLRVNIEVPISRNSSGLQPQGYQPKTHTEGREIIGNV